LSSLTDAAASDTATAAAGSGERSLLRRAAEACAVGGQSFTAGTKVVTASGKAVAISRLRVGQKVLATDTRTGRDQARPVAAVLVHHDTNLYDLKVRTAAGAALIHTTSNHPFWDPAAHRWIKAAALKHGTHLRTPAGGPATVIGGRTPRRRTGWMWDLTIPHVHDFYIQPQPHAPSPRTHAKAGAGTTTAILVHNTGCAPEGGPAAEAASWQGQGAYPGVDKWANVTLPKGTIAHAGEPGVSGFFASDAAAASVGHDATALNEGLQIAPRAGMYRPGLTAFRLTQDVEVGRSVALANPQFGPGGLEQYYIPNWADVTEPVVSRIMMNRVIP